MSSIKYTRRAENNGWLHVQPVGEEVSIINRVGLCEYTKIELTREDTELTYFIVRDGNSRLVGKEAYLHKTNALKFLADSGPPNGSASVFVKYLGEPKTEISRFKGELLQQWATMTVNSVNISVTLNSVWDENYTPINPGTHSIFTPSYSRKHILTTGYVHATPGMHGNDVWFPVGEDISTGRFIHVGHLSEGCITTHALEKWNFVYDYLISCRVPGSMGKLIGKVIVEK